MSDNWKKDRDGNLSPCNGIKANSYTPNTNKYTPTWPESPIEMLKISMNEIKETFTGKKEEKKEKDTTNEDKEKKKNRNNLIGTIIGLVSLLFVAIFGIIIYIKNKNKRTENIEADKEIEKAQNTNKYVTPEKLNANYKDNYKPFDEYNPSDKIHPFQHRTDNLEDIYGTYNQNSDYESVDLDANELHIPENFVGPSDDRKKLRAENKEDYDYIARSLNTETIPYSNRLDEIR